MKLTLHSGNPKRHSDRIVILGDGRSMPEDYGLVSGWRVEHDLGAIGRSIRATDGLAQHWFNLDGETAIAWGKQLKETSNNGLLTHTVGPVDGFDVDWDVQQPDYNYERITHERGRFHGSSALFATLAAIEMGYRRIVLAGCPLDTEGHWYFEPMDADTLGPLWLGIDYMAWLDFAKLETAKRVRSMSGYTADIIGKATREWTEGV